jgi:DNA replication ATP-dependent helicase Dna2
MSDTSTAQGKLLEDMHAFVRDEQRAAQDKLDGLWALPLRKKLAQGLTQRFARLERGDEPSQVWAHLGRGDSRFREGDLLCLHAGDALAPLARRLTLEREDGERWLLRGERALSFWWDHYAGGACYADADAIDLTAFYLQSIQEIGASPSGRRMVLPLLAGELEITFRAPEMDEARAVAEREGFNPAQAEAVALAFGADQVACIQGPPGTGKTRVLALAVQLMVARGERVLVTSHTHTAINHALNQIAARGVPVVKVGRRLQAKGLADGVEAVEDIASWAGWLDNDGYAVGATPFACCSQRLKGMAFETVVFDEASQITVPLALMAMRKGKRFVFIGDPKQLPPVMLSRSVLDKQGFSAFARLTGAGATGEAPAGNSIMLDACYRMNSQLVDWPSRRYYGGALKAVGANAERRFAAPGAEAAFAVALGGEHSRIFIPTLDGAARTVNLADAELVAGLCAAACAAGTLTAADIGIVTPYRAQGRAIRVALAARLGPAEARCIVADTVERMQGQEREMVIVSLATGDEVFLGVVAEFFFQPERLNVAITRAKTKLIIIGPWLGSDFTANDDHLRRWVTDYRDLLAHSRLLRLASPA